MDRLCRPGLVARIEPRLCRVSPPSGFQRLPIAQVGEGCALRACLPLAAQASPLGIARRFAASSRPFGSPRSTLKTDPSLTGCGDLIDGHRAQSPSAAGCRVRPVGVGPVGLHPAGRVNSVSRRRHGRCLGRFAPSGFSRARKQSAPLCGDRAHPLRAALWRRWCGKHRCCAPSRPFVLSASPLPFGPPLFDA